MKNKILITGAGGYVGSLLTNSLLKKGHSVIAFDTFWFGNVLNEHKNLMVIKNDLRFYDFSDVLKNVKTVVHLACLSNDPSYELNPHFSKEINYEGSLKLLRACRESSIERFIFASSSSVYGVKQEEKVVENLSLKPLTPYSFFKVQIEEELAKIANGYFDSVTLRPATLCGPSPRLRLDVIGNIFSAQAFFDRKLIINGGNQYRPQLNIKDMIRGYEMCIFDSVDFHGAIYNIGEKNYTVYEIALLAKNLCPYPVELIVNDVIDNRSYRLDSEKLKKERSFELAFTFREAIEDMFEYFSLQNLNWTDFKFHNIKTIKTILENQEFNNQTRL
jgi:nucleoside-diphosphate-sugar epimerase